MVRDGGAVKVGVSNNVKRRRSGIQASSPDRVAIFHTERPVGLSAFAVEKAAMALLAPWRTSGEWFRCKPELARLAVQAAATSDANLAAFFPRFGELEAATALWIEADRQQVRLRGNRYAEPDARIIANDSEAATRAAYQGLRSQLRADYPTEMDAIDPLFFRTDLARPMTRPARKLAIDSPLP